MNDGKIHDKPSDVEHAEGEVIVSGPDGVAVSLTPDAALETGHRLRVEGHNAKEAAEKERTDSAPDSGTLSTAMARDGVSGLQSQDDRGGDKAAEELEEAHKHADPSRGDKKVDGGDHVSTDDDAPKHKALSEADEQATTTKRTM
jgi:hypothetical protein